MKIILFTFVFICFGASAQTKQAVISEPHIYLGGAKSGDTCSRNNAIFSIRDENGQLLSNYKIISVQLYPTNTSSRSSRNPILFSNETNLSQSMVSLIKATRSGTIVTFLIKVTGSDSIARMVSASFVVR